MFAGLLCQIREDVPLPRQEEQEENFHQEAYSESSLCGIIESMYKVFLYGIIFNEYTSF